jgi:hypothetical protein
MDTLFSGDCDCANDFPSLIRALTWSHYCKCQHVFLGKELWVDGSLEFEHRAVRGKGVVTSRKAFLIWGETCRITSFYYILALALQLNSQGKPQSSSRKLLRTVRSAEFARLDARSLDWPAHFQKLAAKATGDFGQPSAGTCAFRSCRNWAFPHTS